MKKFEDISKKYREALLARSNVPFLKHLGIEIVDVKKGWGLLRLPFKKEICNSLGIAHGGSIFSLADTAIGLALLGMVKQDEFITTVEMKINYLKQFNKGSVTAEAKILHKGANTALGEVDVTTEKGELIAKGLVTYMILKKKNRKEKEGHGKK